MQELTILILLVTAALFGSGAAIAFRLVELTRRLPVIADGSELVGSFGRTVSAVDGRSGWILVENQRWRASTADGARLTANTAVRIVRKLDGLVVHVEPIEARNATIVAFPARGTSFDDREAA